MCEATVEATMVTPDIRKEESMALIQVTVIAGVVTRLQKEEIIERLTEAMVAIEGENMRQSVSCIVEEVGQRRVGRRRPSADRRRCQSAHPILGAIGSPSDEHAGAFRTQAARAPTRSPTSRLPRDHRSNVKPRELDPDRLPDHIDRLYRAASAMCGSRYDAEDLVQETPGVGKSRLAAAAAAQAHAARVVVLPSVVGTRLGGCFA